jgi:hypothetical protein
VRRLASALADGVLSLALSLAAHRRLSARCLTMFCGCLRALVAAACPPHVIRGCLQRSFFPAQDSAEHAAPSDSGNSDDSDDDECVVHPDLDYARTLVAEWEEQRKGRCASLRSAPAEAVSCTRKSARGRSCATDENTPMAVLNAARPPQTHAGDAACGPRASTAEARAHVGLRVARFDARGQRVDSSRHGRPSRSPQRPPVVRVTSALSTAAGGVSMAAAAAAAAGSATPAPSRPASLKRPLNATSGVPQSAEATPRKVHIYCDEQFAAHKERRVQHKARAEKRAAGGSASPPHGADAGKRPMTRHASTPGELWALVSRCCRAR